MYSLRTGESTTGCDADCIFLENSHWDDINDNFVHDPEKKVRKPCFESINTIDCSPSSCISLTWSLEDGLSRNIWSADAMSTEDVTLGNIVLSVPVVFVSGMKISAAVERLSEE